MNIICCQWNTKPNISQSVSQFTSYYVAAKKVTVATIVHEKKAAAEGAHKTLRTSSACKSLET